MEKKKFSMKDKFLFHAHRGAKAFPKGSKMTAKEKKAYSMGYVKHATDSANISNIKLMKTGHR
jgi:hypothetical protein